MGSQTCIVPLDGCTGISKTTSCVLLSLRCLFVIATDAKRDETRWTCQVGCGSHLGGQRVLVDVEREPLPLHRLQEALADPTRQWFRHSLIEKGPVCCRRDGVGPDGSRKTSVLAHLTPREHTHQSCSCRNLWVSAALSLSCFARSSAHVHTWLSATATRTASSASAACVRSRARSISARRPRRASWRATRSLKNSAVCGW